MKDLIFTDPSESTNAVTYRVDLINGNNFSIMKIKGLENVKFWQHKKRALLKTYGTIGQYSNLGDFKTFAQARGLDLVMQDSNGSNQVILVDYNSDFGASSW